MPELPEVETVCRELKPKLQYKKIINVQKFRDKIRNFIPSNIELNLINKEIICIKRLAKYIVITLKESGFLIFHLGMTGKLTVESNKFSISKHDHLVIYLTNDSILVFNDTRRFGIIDYFDDFNELTQKYFANIGVEPLTSEFNTAYLLQKIKNKKLLSKIY